MTSIPFTIPVAACLLFMTRKCRPTGLLCDI